MINVLNSVKLLNYMTGPYMLFGRRVVAYVPTEKTNMVVIDVRQQEGDCPNRFIREARMVCENDCADTFATVSYSAVTGKIGLNGFLAHDLRRFQQESTLPVNIVNLSDYQGIMLTETIYVLRDAMVGPTRHCFFAAVKPGTITGMPAVDRYFEYLNHHIEEVMRECGVTILKKGKKPKFKLRNANNHQPYELKNRMLNHLMSSWCN